MCHVLKSQALVVASIALGVLVFGCGSKPTAEIGFERLNDLVVANGGIHAYVGTTWRRDGEEGGSFRKVGSLLFFVEGGRPDELRVTLRPRAATRDFHFVAMWDGEAVWESPLTAASIPLTVRIPAEGLAPGIHRLSLERFNTDDGVGENAASRSRFSRIEIRGFKDDVGVDVPVRFNPYVADFLDFGVTGQNSTRLGGCLFIGPQIFHLDVSSVDDREGIFTCQNQSRAESRFSVAIDGVEIASAVIEARGSAPIRFDLPGGSHNLTMKVEGLSSGHFLWGSPHVDRRDDALRTPVVLITLDTTRRDVVYPYSDRPEMTPELARLAGMASIYTNAYATSPWTLPSHASIFTGLYPSHHRAGVQDDALELSWMTLADRFRDAGYLTAGFAGGSMASSRFGLAQGFSLFVDPRKNEETADVITDAAVEFIEGHSERPLFLFLNYFDPHGPYSAPVDFRKQYGVEALGAAVDDVDGWGAFARGEPTAWKRIREGRVPPNRAGLALLRAEYEAEVAYMDDRIGRLFDVLRERGLFDPALIVVAADHGEFLGERGLYSHSFRLDRELTAIPMMIKWPYQKTTEIIDDLVSQVDLYPTVAGVVDRELPRSDGVMLTRSSTVELQARDRVYMEEHASRFHQLEGPAWVADHLIGLQWLDYREVLLPGSSECLRRIGGTWADGQCEQTWDQRLSELSAAMQAAFSLETDFSALDLNEEEADRLRALGYLQ